MLGQWYCARRKPHFQPTFDQLLPHPKPFRRKLQAIGIILLSDVVALSENKDDD
ncbi:hypothetical protein V6245_09130 [Salinibacterium amurskyense]|uniref:hypothetical protein n=1 Tax=Salinibacterium amurskyense TaxID=205941 RepID=UPI00311F8B45